MMTDAPVIGGYEGRTREVCERADALETKGARRQREAAEARAIAGPDAGEADEILIADGGSDESNAHATRTNEMLRQAEAGLEDEPLDVGDHVQDADDPDATMVVMRKCEDLAGEYFIEDIDESVAEYNGCGEAERVYQVVYASRTDRDLADCQRYPFPRSRLELVEPVHDRDGENGGGA